MKYNKLLLVILCLTSLNAKAETLTIETAIIGTPSAVPGTLNKSCTKATVTKQNSGTLVTGLTAANVKLLSSLVQTASFVDGEIVSTLKKFNAQVSLTASVAPAQAGAYDLCITPIGNAWGGTGAQHSFFGIIKGTVAADNGVFQLIE